MNGLNELSGPHALVPNTNPSKVLKDTSIYGDDLIRVTINEIITNHQPKLRAIFINSVSSYFPQTEDKKEYTKQYRDQFMKALFDVYTEIATDVVNENMVRYKLDLLKAVANELHKHVGVNTIPNVVDTGSYGDNVGVNNVVNTGSYGDNDATINHYGGGGFDINGLASGFIQNGQNSIAGVANKQNPGGSMNEEDEIKFKYPLHYLEMYSKNVTMKSVQHMMYSTIQKTIIQKINENSTDLVQGNTVELKPFLPSTTTPSQSKPGLPIPDGVTNMLSNAVGADVTNMATNAFKSMFGGDDDDDDDDNEKEIVNPEDVVIDTITSPVQTENKLCGLQKLCDTIFETTYLPCVRGVHNKQLQLLLNALWNDPALNEQLEKVKMMGSSPNNLVFEITQITYIDPALLKQMGGASSVYDNLLTDLDKYLNDHEVTDELGELLGVSTTDVNTNAVNAMTDVNTDVNVANKQYTDDFMSRLDDNLNDPEFINEVNLLLGIQGDVNNNAKNANVDTNIVDTQNGDEYAKIEDAIEENGNPSKKTGPAFESAPPVISSKLDTKATTLEVPRRTRILKIVSILLNSIMKSLLKWVNDDKTATTHEIVKYVYEHVCKTITAYPPNNVYYQTMTQSIGKTMMSAFTPETHRAFFNMLVFGQTEYLNAWEKTITAHLDTHREFQPSSVWTQIFHTPPADVIKLYDTCASIYTPIMDVAQTMYTKEQRFSVFPIPPFVKYDAENKKEVPPINKLIYDVIDFHYDYKKDKIGSEYSLLVDETPISHAVSHFVINHRFMRLITDIFKNACGDSTEYVMPVVINNALEHFGQMEQFLTIPGDFPKHMFYDLVFQMPSVQTLVTQMFMGILFEAREAIRAFLNDPKHPLVRPNGEAIDKITELLLFTMYYHEDVNYYGSADTIVAKELVGEVKLKHDEQKPDIQVYYNEYCELFGKTPDKNFVEGFAVTFSPDARKHVTTSTKLPKRNR